MKFILNTIFVFSCIASLNAQTNTIKTTKVKFNDYLKDGVLNTTKVKVVTTKSQSVALNPHQKQELNQDLIHSPKSITKTIYIDNDGDSFYDLKSELFFMQDHSSKKHIHVDDNALFIKKGGVQVTKTDLEEIINGKKMILYYNNKNELVVEYVNTDVSKEENFFFKPLFL
ncbi:hypothetical protein [Pseudofulvibacter geojedonensis]|uniref:Organic solvent tolerance-like N-terminal domain-containing protein n=1 Tax=Pseudofulvibacter geojedonensis TaxID=1123758 RepID=A0ABW3I1P8_9FLAO